MMVRKYLSLLLVIGIFGFHSLPANAKNNSKTYSGFRNGSLGISKMSIMPPTVMFAKYTDSGIEPRPNLALEAEDLLVKVTKSALWSAGYDIVPSNVTRETLTTNKDMNYYYRILNTRYMKFLEAGNQNEGGTWRGENTLGPTAAYFGDRAGAEALVFILGAGIQMSGVSSPTLIFSNVFAFKVTIVDAENGRVIFETPIYGAPIPKKSFNDVSVLTPLIVEALGNSLNRLPRQEAQKKVRDKAQKETEKKATE